MKNEWEGLEDISCDIFAIAGYISAKITESTIFRVYIYECENEREKSSLFRVFERIKSMPQYFNPDDLTINQDVIFHNNSKRSCYFYIPDLENDKIKELYETCHTISKKFSPIHLNKRFLP